MPLWADKIREQIANQNRQLWCGVKRANMELRRKQHTHRHAIVDLGSCGPAALSAAR